MIRETGDMSIADANDMNVPIVCFLFAPTAPHNTWRWTARNFMPRKECCGGSYEIHADTKEEILSLLDRYVIPLYENALNNLRQEGENYYWTK